MHKTSHRLRRLQPLKCCRPQHCSPMSCNLLFLHIKQETFCKFYLTICFKFFRICQTGLKRTLFLLQLALQPLVGFGLLLKRTLKTLYDAKRKYAFLLIKCQSCVLMLFCYEPRSGWKVARVRLSTLCSILSQLRKHSVLQNK